jgi:orotidine-5'-phosphate decarboxylase
MFVPNSAQDRLIVALDVDNTNDARKIVDDLRDQVGAFKIGLQLFSAGGPEVVRSLVATGARVFLDLKFHDIPNTVEGAVRECVRLKVLMLNVHAAGGGEMLKRAAEAVRDEAAKLGRVHPKLIAVTVLTSADQSVLDETGIDSSVESQVMRLAKLAHDSGLDGVVASPQEISPIRKALGNDFLIVTPGVRPAGASRADQKRVATPAEAVDAGADFLVMGRAILDAPDPREAVRQIVEEMESVSRS